MFIIVIRNTHVGISTYHKIDFPQTYDYIQNCLCSLRHNTKERQYGRQQKNCPEITGMEKKKSETQTAQVPPHFASNQVTHL